MRCRLPELAAAGQAALPDVALLAHGAHHQRDHRADGAAGAATQAARQATAAPAPRVNEAKKSNRKVAGGSAGWMGCSAEGGGACFVYIVVGWELGRLTARQQQQLLEVFLSLWQVRIKMLWCCCSG